MTQDEIIEMAKQAGIEEAYSLKHNQYLVRFKDGSLEVFAKLVAEAEREACAKVCEDLHPGLATRVAAEHIRSRKWL